MPIERPSDREYICFFCFEGKTKDEHDRCPCCGKMIDISPYLENKTIEGYTLQNFVGRGYYGFTFRAENRIGKPFALKLVPSRLYEKHDKSFAEEIVKYQKLGVHQNIAELIDADLTKVDVDGVEIEFYWLIMEWIEGVSLTKYLSKGKVSPNEINGVIIDIAAGLERFESENLWHNDLNSDNIMLKPLSEDEKRTRLSGSPYICKIVDIGSAIFRQAPQFDRLSDLKFLGIHINDLIKVARTSTLNLIRGDEYFLDSLDRLISRLLDEDNERGFKSARQVSIEVSELYNQQQLREEGEVTLTDPFAYLNANDFPSDAYINYLFSGSFPWISDILTSEAQGTLVTGPRGSGKTMILRSIRLKTRLSAYKPNEEISDIRDRVSSEPQLAFYVSARIEIGNHCSLSKLPKWTESERFVVYYFLLLYTVEILDTFCYGVAKKVFDFDAIAESRFCGFLGDALGLENTTTFTNTLREVKVTQYAIERDSLNSLPGSVLLDSTFFSNLSDNIRFLDPLFATKGITFLLDDFSLPKIPEKIQQILLPLIWNSGGGYSFRVSAHSESVASMDIRGNRYQINREFREINLGASYINSIDLNQNESVIDAFIGEIFAKRFSISSKLKDVTLQDLLGADFDGKIGKEIRTRNENNTTRGLRYHGRNTLIKLCSGDISYLIDMLGQMLRTAKKYPIGIDRQHKVIREYAWRELYRLNDFPAGSCNLYDVALNFGKLSRFKLLGREINETSGKSRPSEYLRIEVALEHEQESVRKIVAELLQYGVFIDGGFSNSSQQKPARRLIFRKIFTPAFPTTYNSRDTFSMTTAHFLKFVTHPEQFLRERVAEAGVKPEDQPSLLDKLADKSDV